MFPESRVIGKNASYSGRFGAGASGNPVNEMVRRLIPIIG